MAAQVRGMQSSIFARDQGADTRQTKKDNIHDTKYPVGAAEFLHPEGFAKRLFKGRRRC